MQEYFMIIDPQKNTLLVPAPSKGIFQAIAEAGVQNVIHHDSERQLLLHVKEFTRSAAPSEDTETGDVGADS